MLVNLNSDTYKVHRGNHVKGVSQKSIRVKIFTRHRKCKYYNFGNDKSFVPAQNECL